jgi:uncharacterized protein YhaN
VSAELTPAERAVLEFQAADIHVEATILRMRKLENEFFAAIENRARRRQALAAAGVPVCTKCTRPGALVGGLCRPCAIA